MKRNLTIEVISNGAVTTSETGVKTHSPAVETPIDEAIKSVLDDFKKTPAKPGQVLNVCVSIELANPAPAAKTV